MLPRRRRAAEAAAAVDNMTLGRFYSGILFVVIIYPSRTSDLETLLSVLIEQVAAEV